MNKVVFNVPVGGQTVKVEAKISRINGKIALSARNIWFINDRGHHDCVVADLVGKTEAECIEVAQRMITEAVTYEKDVSEKDHGWVMLKRRSI